ncbi:ATP-binding cassette domain-containing protein [Candidatus Gillettellia adelgis]
MIFLITLVELKVLYNVSFKIHQGEVIVIIRPFRSGKSTLLCYINKLKSMTSGELIMNHLYTHALQVDYYLIRQDTKMVS